MMNYETRIGEGAGSALTLEDGEALQRRRKRRFVIFALVLIAFLLIAAWMFMGSKGNAPQGGAAATSAGANGESNKVVPVVTVVSPGSQVIERRINATGSLAARREMPVGVAGEGGMVTRVYVEPGQWVAAGQVLASIDREVQTQTNAQLAAQINVARADARLAQANLERAQRLVAGGFVSKADIDQKTATRDAALARVRVAQAALAENRARTGRLDIRAPAAGLVLTRNVEPGQVVSAGSGVLFRLAKGGELELLAQLNEADLASLPVGSRAAVTPVGTSQIFEGQVWQISPVVNAQTRQGTARIALAYDRALRPGGFATAQIVSGAAQAPLLPESAILSDDKGAFVYIVGKDNKVVRQAVETGTVTDKGIAVTKGLVGTERVVLRSGAFLSPGDTVKPQLHKP